MDEDQDVMENFQHMQEAITNWGKLLLVTGGALKPSKCFFHLISFKWNKAGVWSYDNNEENKEYRARVPLADGSFGDIEHLTSGGKYTDQDARFNDVPNGLQ